MRISFPILIIISCLGCKPKNRNVAIEAPPADEGTNELSDYDDGSYEEGDDSSSQSDFAPFSDCEDPCKSAEIRVRAIDYRTKARVSTFTGRSGLQSAWAFQAKSKKKGRSVGVRLIDIPNDAQQANEAGVAIMLWLPENQTSGSIRIASRDISRCVFEAQEDESEDDEVDCQDMEIEDNEFVEKFETTKTFRYTIKKGDRELLEERQEEAKQQQCTASMMSGILGSLPTMFGGNPTAGIAGAAQGAIPCLL